MLNTKDEILRAFAAGILDDIDDLLSKIPPPAPPRFDKPEEEAQQEEEVVPEDTQVAQQPIPIPVPEEQVPISVREERDEDSKSFDEPKSDNPWSAQDAGTAEWTAEFYPEAFLLGHAPFTGYIKRPESQGILERAMSELVYGYPEKYFEWRLDRREQLRPYQETAARILIEKDPEHALIINLPRVLPISLYHLLPELWAKMGGPVDQNDNDTSKWPGVIYDRMRDLAIKIRDYVPEFYEKIKDFDVTQSLMSGEGRVVRNPVSSREGPTEGSLEWLSEKYPQVYLKGMDDRRNPRGHTRERSGLEYLEKITENTIDRLLDSNPIKFFEWGLNRPRDLQKYIPVASEKIVENDPQGALMARMFEKSSSAIFQ